MLSNLAWIFIKIKAKSRENIKDASNITLINSADFSLKYYR